MESAICCHAQKSYFFSLFSEDGVRHNKGVHLECTYGALLAAAAWQHLVRRVGTDIGLLSSSNRPCAIGHSSQDLDMVVHGDVFIIAGNGDDLDWFSQKLNEKLEWVQQARLGLGFDNEATVLNRCAAILVSQGKLTRGTENWQLQSLVFRRRVHKRSQVVLNQMHHWTTKNWNLMDKMPITAYQQDCLIWHRTDLTLHSLAKSAYVQSGKQHMLISLV